jgi:hypothetical protein
VNARSIGCQDAVWGHASLVSRRRHMTMDEFVTLIELKSPPAPQDRLEAFEAELAGLPDDYRQFLARTNGGVIRGGTGS